MPDGTKYADYANVHNYLYHPNSPYPRTTRRGKPLIRQPRREWMVSTGISASRGRSGFGGYTQEELNSLPRVTTETGVWVAGPITEELQGLNLMNVYLAQFKRG